MGDTITNKIVLEGEAEYKKALADINRTLKENKSAMKAAAAEYDGAGESMEAMYRYGDSLEQTMQSQIEALGLMSEHLSKVESAYGKNSREATELRTKINNMRTELAKTQTQMRQFEGSMDNAAAAGDNLQEGLENGNAGFEELGRSADAATDKVDDLSEAIADAVGTKIIDFTIAGKAFDTLKGGLKEAVTWAIDDAVDGLREWSHTRAVTGDDPQTDRRMAMKDMVDRNWSGRRDGIQTSNDVAAVDTALANMGITDDARVIKLTNYAITLEEVFGQSVQSTVDRATAMVNTFGVSWETAIDLMTKGMRDMSDGGAQMLEAYERYGQSYKQLGYDIDDMYSAIAAAANDEELGKSSNLNKGVEALIKNLTDGSKESKKTLKALGAEITDLPGKFQEGGDAAAKAVQVILTKLQAVTDEVKRNELGKALFGDTVWIESSGRIVDVILAGYDKVVDATGSTADAMAAELDNVGDNWAGLGERLGQMVSVIWDPIVKGGNNALKQLNEGIDNGEMLLGLGRAILSWGDGLHNAIDPMIADLAQSTSERISEIFAVAPETLGLQDAIATATADLYAQLDDLNEKINLAWMNGDTLEALTLEEQKRKLIDEIAAVKQTVMEGFGDVGTEAATSLEGKAAEMGKAGETLSDEAVGAVTDAQTDMNAAGETLGKSGVTGLEAGLSGMIGASADAVDGVVAELYRGVSRAYAAGQATGAAYERGYKTKLGIASPSRVMQEAAEYTTDPLFDRFERDRARLRAAGAALAAAVAEGYENTQGLASGAQSGSYGVAAGMNGDSLVQAMRTAMSGMTWELNGHEFAVLMEPGVSRATQQRTCLTVRGQGSATRSW